MLPGVRVRSGAALAPPSRFPELVARFLAAALAVVGISLLFVGAFASAHSQATLVDRGPPCLLRLTTGIECPFCGMTRATIAMGAGDWHHAFALHPLAPFVLAFALSLLGIVALGKTRTLLVGRRPLYVVATIGAIWIVRLIAG